MNSYGMPQGFQPPQRNTYQGDFVAPTEETVQPGGERGDLTTKDYIEIAYDVLRGGVNLYKAIKGEPTIRFAENLLSPSSNVSFNPPGAVKGPVETSIETGMQNAKDQALRAFVPEPEAAVAIPVEPFEGPSPTSGTLPAVGDEPFLENGKISAQTMRTLLSRGYTLPTADELRGMGYGVFTDGSDRVTGYQKPDGTQVQWEY